MFRTRFKDVCIESYALHMPTTTVSSAEIEDRIAPLYERLNVPFGTLEKLSGVSTRGCFTHEETPSVIATEAARKALEGSGVDISKMGALFSCSVTRDYFEPATALLVHRNLEMPETSMAMDITNACVGFSNGMVMLAQLIEAGVVQAGVVVSGENLIKIMETTFDILLDKEDITRKELLELMPTFTLGSGAVAAVLCHKDIATRGHQLVASTARSASQHNELCMGNGDFCFNQLMGLNPVMTTDSQKLIASAAKLGNRTWNDATELLGWSGDDIDHIICHQVGKQVNSIFYDTMGLPIEKEYTVYERYGNLVSAALPSALFTAAEEGRFTQGDRILLTGFGSGLNAVFTGLVW